jgi:hypothetical protein
MMAGSLSDHGASDSFASPFAAPAGNRLVVLPQERHPYLVALRERPLRRVGGQGLDDLLGVRGHVRDNVLVQAAVEA